MKIMEKGYFILFALTLVIFIMGSVSASGIDNFTADGADDALCSVDDDVILDSSDDDEISQSINDDMILDSSRNSNDLLSSENNGELLSSVDDDEDLSYGELDDIIGDEGDDLNSSDDLNAKTYIEINEYDYIYDANPHSVNINDETDYVARIYTTTEAGGNVTVYIGKELDQYTQEIAFIEDIQTLDKVIDENNHDYATYYIRPNDLEDFNLDWYYVQVIYRYFISSNYTEVGVVRFVDEPIHVMVDAPYEIVAGDWDNSYITVFVEDTLGYLKVLIDNELVFEDSVDNLMYTEEDGYNHFIPIYLGDLSVGMHSYNISYYNGTWNNETFSGEIEVTYLFDVITDYDYYSDEELDFEEGEIYYGDEIEFIFVLPYDASSNQIKVNGQVYELNLTDGIGSLTLSDFNIGDNELVFTYDDPYYGEKTYTVNLTVKPKVIIPEIVSDLNRDKIEFKLPKDAQGELKISIINGSESIKNDTVTLNDGEANYSFENLPFGSYSIKLEYNYGNYTISNETNITVLPHVEISNETVMSQDASISVDMDNVQGSIDVYIDGNKWNNESLVLDDGKINLTIPASDLHVGENKVTLNLTGQNNPFSILNSDGELVPFEYVILVKPIEFSVPDTFADGDGNITIELPEGASGNITVKVNGEENSTTEVSSGTNTIPLFGFGLGNYNVEVVYTDENGNNYTISKKITVSKSVPSADILIPRDSETPELTIDFPNDATGFLSIHIDGKDYVAELANGKAIIALPGLADGTYDVIIKYTGDNKYEEFTKRATVTIKTTPKTVPLKDPNLKITVKNIYKGKKAIVTITANAAFSGKVIVKIKSKTYVVKVVKGKGSISISGLAVGTYKATATLTGNKVFKSSTKSTSFKVKANVYKLTLKKVKVKKSAKKLVIKATLKINGKKVKGKKLTFKFNKKTYKAKTNKKGIAKITIKKKVLKKLKVGKKVKYQVKYGKKIAKRTVKVKK